MARQALASIRAQRPDLVLTDVMMPRLDGFGLCAPLRADPGLRDRSGRSCSRRAPARRRASRVSRPAPTTILTKPFGARELLARIQANLAMARVRREAARRERELRWEAEDLRARLGTLLEQMPAGAMIANASAGIILANDQAAELLKHPVIFTEKLEELSPISRAPCRWPSL